MPNVASQQLANILESLGVGGIIVPKEAAVAATTGPITLSGIQTIDGILLKVGDRVLVKDQANPATNGPYICSSVAWSRSTDTVVSGISVFVVGGLINKGKTFTLITNNPITLGTTPLTFSVTGTSISIDPGTGLELVGSMLNVTLDNTTVFINANGDISATGMTQTERDKLAGIAANANNYVHPTTHPASMIVEDSTHLFVTTTEKTTWNAGTGGSGPVADGSITTVKLADGSVTAAKILDGTIGMAELSTTVQDAIASGTIAIIPQTDPVTNPTAADVGKIILTTISVVGNPHFLELTITSGATASGNFGLSLLGNGTFVNTALLSTDNTPALVAAKIRAKTNFGWTTGGTGNVVTFSKDANLYNEPAFTPIIQANATGIVSSFTTVIIGTEYVAQALMVCVKKGNAYIWKTIDYGIRIGSGAPPNTAPEYSGQLFYDTSTGTIYSGAGGWNGDVPSWTVISGPSFKTIAVAGQSNVNADSPADTLTLTSGAGITITTDGTTDTITISATGGGTGTGDMLESEYATNGTAGVVDKAVRLQTPRTIQLSGSISSNAVAFDGSADITLTTTGGGSGGAGTTGFRDLKIDFGAVGNGIANDTAAIQSALDNGVKVIVPPGTYLIAGDLNMNILTSMLEGVNAIFKSTTGLRTINVLNGTSITGIKFDQVYIKLLQNHKNPGRFYIDHCTFINGDYAIRPMVGWAGVGFAGEMPQNIIITNNVFDNHLYGIFGGLSYSFIAHNTFKNTRSRNIEFNAGSENVIYDNWVDGGVTGIIFLIDASLNQRMPANNNVIHGNHVYNVSEEAISFDANADLASQNASRITGTVASIDASTTTRIVPSFAMGTADEHTSFYVTFHTGKSRGQSHKVANMGTGTQWLEIPTADKNFITVGDRFTVVVGCVGNIISNNVVKVAQTGITCYGASVGTIIEGNHVFDCFGEMGILIRSLYGTLGGDLGIVHNALVQGNVVENCEIAADVNFFGTTPITTLAVGNKFQDNIVTNGSVIYQHQYDDSLCKDNTVNGMGSAQNIPTQPANIQYTANGVPMAQTLVEAGTVTWAFSGLAYDLFDNRTSATALGSAIVGGAWTAVAGTWGTIGNEAYCVSDVSGDRAVLPSVGTPNYMISCAMKGSITDANNRSRPAIIFRYVDSSNFLLAYLEAGMVFIGKSDAGVTSDLDSTPYATSNNTFYNFKVICKDNAIKVMVNGVCVSYYMLTAAEQAKYGNAGQVGMRLSKSGSPPNPARWDKLVVESIL